jgi:hypothetical protein
MPFDGSRPARANVRWTLETAVALAVTQMTARGPTAPPAFGRVEPRTETNSSSAICQSNVAGVHGIMKPFCFAAAFVVLTAGCSSTWSPANNQAARPSPANTDTYILHTTNGAMPSDSTSTPPRLSVGVSYPDTQLILPWFLNDIINFINYR